VRPAEKNPFVLSKRSLIAGIIDGRYSLIWGGGPKAKQEVEETFLISTNFLDRKMSVFQKKDGVF